MKNKYHVIYFNGKEKKIYRVISSNKQEAYNMFRTRVSNTYKVIDIVNISKRINVLKLITMISIITIVLGMLISFIIHMSQTPQPVAYEKYIVEQGDTLWSIAKLSNGSNCHVLIDYIIDDIMNASGCTTFIVPDQIVYIPMY